MVFRDIFKRVKDEVDKRARGPEQPKGEEQKREEHRYDQGENGRYERLAAWIKTSYGKRFRDGQSSAEVESQLQSIFKELEARGDFQKYPKIANGFKAYISQRKYGDLVKVSG